MADSTNSRASSDPPKAPAKARDSFGAAAPWLKFLAVLGYIGVTLLLVVGVAFTVVGLVVHPAFGFPLLRLLGPFLGLFYVVLAVVIYFLVRILMRLAKSAKLYGTTGSADDLDSLGANFYAFAKFYGTLVIVIVSLYVLAALGFGVFMAIRALS